MALELADKGLIMKIPNSNVSIRATAEADLITKRGNISYVLAEQISLKSKIKLT